MYQLQEWSEQQDVWLNVLDIGPKPFMVAILKAHVETYPERGWRLRACLTQ